MDNKKAPLGSWRYMCEEGETVIKVSEFEVVGQFEKGENNSN